MIDPRINVVNQSQSVTVVDSEGVVSIAQQLAAIYLANPDQRTDSQIFESLTNAPTVVIFSRSSGLISSIAYSHPASTGITAHTKTMTRSSGLLTQVVDALTYSGQVWTETLTLTRVSGKISTETKTLTRV